MKLRTNLGKRPAFVYGAASVCVLLLTGCPKAPETVPFVDLERYAGLWYQTAGYPFPPTDNLVGITAEYTPLEDGTIEVVNKGFVGDFDGPLDTIVGIARVTDPATNSKLAVRFPSVLGGIFEGQYWIIDLDEQNYSYAVVSDAFRRTLFILNRTPVMDAALFDSIVADLAARGFDTSRIEITLQMPES